MDAQRTSTQSVEMWMQKMTRALIADSLMPYSETHAKNMSNATAHLRRNRDI